MLRVAVHGAVGAVHVLVNHPGNKFRREGDDKRLQRREMTSVATLRSNDRLTRRRHLLILTADKMINDLSSLPDGASVTFISSKPGKTGLGPGSN